LAEAAPPEITPTDITEVAAVAPSGELPLAQAEESPEAVPSPPAEETPPAQPSAERGTAPEVSPEPVRQRTLGDVYEDVRNNRPVLPNEMRAIQDYEARQLKAQQDAQAEEQRVATLFPTQKQKALETMAQFMGVSDLESTEGMALKYKLNEVFEPLEKDARSAFTTPLLKTVGTQLWDALGRSREAHAAIQSLSPDKLIPFAIEVGRNLGATSPDVAPEAEVAKWHEGGKLDPKKLITVEQAEARMNKALDVERRARGTAPPPVGAGREGTGLTRSFSREELSAMPIEDYQKLSDDERRRYWAAAAS
jgi:hypothetical protein